MIPLINKLAQQYAEQHTTAEDELLEEVAAYTIAHTTAPHMLSGMLQGSFLQLVSKLLQPKKILEVGTFTGYSALCMAKGMHKHGELHTLERDEKMAKIATSFFTKSSYERNIQLHVGDARAILPTLQHSWDMVFIDADKKSYIQYYELAKAQLNENGIIIADNVLYHGEVLQEIIEDKTAKAIHEFNKHVCADKTVNSLLLPIRDGLMLVQKK
jgi:caffeoyl-CoA O-methyltransferase